jgi:hypothetical protein
MQVISSEVSECRSKLSMSLVGFTWISMTGPTKADKRAIVNIGYEVMHEQVVQVNKPKKLKEDDDVQVIVMHEQVACRVI